MKSVVFILIVITIATSVKVKSSFQLSMESKIQALKKTGWGKVAAGLMELQVKTGGPMSELVTAFKNLIRDLNFKLNSEHQEYRWAAAENHEFNIEWNEKLRDAKVRFAVASTHLVNSLYPQRKKFEDLIATDEALEAKLVASREAATAERNQNQATFEKNSHENAATMEAVEECIKLLRGLQRQGSNFVQLNTAKTHVNKLIKKLKVSSSWGHLAKALVKLTQNFADKSAIQKVLNLFTKLKGNLFTSQEEAEAANKQDIAEYRKFMRISGKDLAQCRRRLKENRATLAVWNRKIADMEERRDIAKADRDNASTKLADEKARWAQVQADYKDFIHSIKIELDAVSRCIGVFSGADVNDDMLKRIDW